MNNAVRVRKNRCAGIGVRGRKWIFKDSGKVLGGFLSRK